MIRVFSWRVRAVVWGFLGFTSGEMGTRTATGVSQDRLVLAYLFIYVNNPASFLVVAGFPFMCYSRFSEYGR